jgi:hypothetical protein
MSRLDDFIIGPQSDEFNEFDLDFDIPEDKDIDDEYYEDGTELFSLDLSNIEGTIESIIEELDLTEPDEKELYNKLVRVKDDKTVLSELKEICMDNVCNSDIISNYISDYSVSELGDMDGIWNEFGDILRETVYKYFDFI